MRSNPEIARRMVVKSISSLALLWSALGEAALAAPDPAQSPPREPQPTLARLKIASARAVKSSSATFDVEIRIGENEGRRLRAFTSRFVGRFAEIRLDGRIIIAARINEPLSGPVVWISLYGPENEAKQLADDLTGKELVVTIEP